MVFFLKRLEMSQFLIYINLGAYHSPNVRTTILCAVNLRHIGSGFVSHDTIHNVRMNFYYKDLEEKGSNEVQNPA